ncbi:hypothetical protein EYF80_010806 [Liparis tanakae]|uniref:Uncharacterized protein n=1 Tax=Liparis tanakae TaxID=230148 RepID=A0A4Z2ILE3_9TELE|nr:hypothetical protein EYF80_010806 [Liparis tanakae]
MTAELQSNEEEYAAKKDHLKTDQRQDETQTYDLPSPSSSITHPHACRLLSQRENPSRFPE